MALVDAQLLPAQKIDAAERFRKLGLKPADGSRIMDDWRRANLAWRQERLRRITAHAQRVQGHLRRFGKSPRSLSESRRHMGRPRAVWCVELGRSFPSLTAAAAFVGRSPSNISQAILRGVRCGPYHWEVRDPVKCEP